MKKEKRERTGHAVRIYLIMMLMWVFAYTGVSAQQDFGTPFEEQNQNFNDYNFSETLPAENFFNENGPYLRDDEDDEYDDEDNGPGGHGHGAATGVGVPVGEGLLILLLNSVSYAGVIFIRKYKK